MRKRPAAGKPEVVKTCPSIEPMGILQFPLARSASAFCPLPSSACGSSRDSGVGKNGLPFPGMCRHFGQERQSPLRKARQMRSRQTAQPGAWEEGQTSSMGLAKTSGLRWPAGKTAAPGIPGETGAPALKPGLLGEPPPLQGWPEPSGGGRVASAGPIKM